MPLSIEEKKSIIAYRVQKADSVFIEASDNATMNHWNLVANRLYYAVFHMASALLIDKGFTSKTHNGVICLLGQEFATKGLLDKDEMRLVSRLQNMRHAGDYDDMFDWAEEDVKPLFNRTELLIKKMKSFIIVGGIVCFILLILPFSIISDWHGPIVEKSLKLLAQMFFRHFSVAKIKYLQFNLTIHPKPQ